MSNLRNIVCQLHRGRDIIWTRYYKYIDTAVPRATALSLSKGQPLDVLQFSHAVTGLALGELRISAKQSMTFTPIPSDPHGTTLLELCSSK